MCELIAELAALDERCVSTKVDQYIAPTKTDTGRYPDVFVDWGGFGQFAVEYQMSHTFQTEVSQRCVHYEKEGIPLLWVFSTFDPDKIPQAVSDVIHRHRGNAFVVDQAAVAASRQENTLVLSCCLSDGVGFEGSVLARFDELEIPASKLPFLEDRLVKPLLDEISNRRRPYFRAFHDWGDRIEDLRVDDLSAFSERKKVDRLVAAAFSIVAEAAGKPHNYASEHNNIKGMLNTYLSSKTLPGFAQLLTELISNTSQRDLLKGSVGKHLRKAIDGHRTGEIYQVDQSSPEWVLLKKLFPEALDPFVRQRLVSAYALPTWAT